MYQLIVIRSLSPFDYGIFSSLFALLYIILIATGVIGIVVTKYTAAYYANREFGKIKSLFTSLSAKILIIGLAIFFIFVLCSRFIADFMNLSSVFPVLLVGLLGFLSLFMPIYDGILAGMQKFNFKAVGGTIVPFFKIVFLILFTYLGYELNGAFFALILACPSGAWASADYLSDQPVWFSIPDHPTRCMAFGDLRAATCGLLERAVQS